MPFLFSIGPSGKNTKQQVMSHERFRGAFGKKVAEAGEARANANTTLFLTCILWKFDRPTFGILSTRLLFFTHDFWLMTTKLSIASKPVHLSNAVLDDSAVVVFAQGRSFLFRDCSAVGERDGTTVNFGSRVVHQM